MTLEKIIQEKDLFISHLGEKLKSFEGMVDYERKYKKLKKAQKKKG